MNYRRLVDSVNADGFLAHVDARGSGIDLAGSNDHGIIMGTPAAFMAGVAFSAAIVNAFDAGRNAG